MTERIDNSRLLQQAADTLRSKREEKLGTEAARERIGELESKMRALLELDVPPQEEPEDPDKPTIVRDDERTRLTPEFFSKVDASIRKSYEPTIATFSVPLDEEVIVVRLSKGIKSRSSSSYIDNGYEINVLPLDSVLRIDGRGAVVESKDHKRKPFDMHTPIGPRSNSDLGPMWRREMSMEDFNSYNQLLDRLSEPDVTRLPAKS